MKKANVFLLGNMNIPKMALSQRFIVVHGRGAKRSEKFFTKKVITEVIIADQTDRAVAEYGLFAKSILKKQENIQMQLYWQNKSNLGWKESAS